MTLKSPASTTGSSPWASSSTWAAARSTCSAACFGRLRRVQVREEKARETNDLADPRLRRARPERPVWVQHDDALLQYLEVSPHENRVPLAREERPEVAVVQRGDEAVERPRQARAARHAGDRVHTAPLLEPPKRPDRQLLETNHVGPVDGDEAHHLFEVRVPPRRRRVPVEQVPAPDQHCASSSNAAELLGR